MREATYAILAMAHKLFASVHGIQMNNMGEVGQEANSRVLKFSEILPETAGKNL